ncbi:MAG: paraquat-inducible protein A [Planctomycetota bacterium]|jgi:paraquat-inducible protein A
MDAAAGPTARNLGLLSCHVCQRLYPAQETPAGHHLHCSLCKTSLHQRKSNSLARTWALVIAAALLYLPANIFPIMSVVISGRGEPDTILSGVVALINADALVIAILIFFASITVPMLKLLGLTYLLISVQRRSYWRPKDRTRLYRLIEVIGRWSMIDMFMLSILVALVKLGAVATIEPGIGATSFAGVVVITMFAAESFDPRLIWDSIEETDDRRTKQP